MSRQPQNQAPASAAAAGGSGSGGSPAPRALYMGRSVGDLNRRAERSVAGVTNTAAGVQLLLRYFMAAEKFAQVDRDEERAYILYVRALLVFGRVCRLRDFSRAQFLHLQEVQRATDEAERLAEVLKVRYKNDATSRTINELQGFESLTRQISLAERDPQAQSAAGPPSTAADSASLRELPIIDAKSLQRLLTSPQTVVAFDLRTDDEFAKCRLKHASVVGIDGRDLRPDFTYRAIEFLVQPHQLPAWHTAIGSGGGGGGGGGASPVLVLVLAWSPEATERLAKVPNGGAAILRLALARASPSLSPRLLVDGLQGVALTCPSLLTNPAYRGPAADTVEVVSSGSRRSDSSADSSDPLGAVSTTGLHWLYPSTPSPSAAAPAGAPAAAAAAPAAAAAVKQQPARSPAEVSTGEQEQAVDTSQQLHLAGQRLWQLLGSVQDHVTPIKPESLRRLEPRPGPVACGLTGLRNRGNSCYMNCVLQCLSNTPALAMYFLDGTYRSHVNERNPLGHGGRLADRFADLCWALWCGAHASLSPADLGAAVDLGSAGGQELQQQQEDAQEFLLYLLDGLHEDLNRAAPPRPTGGSSAAAARSSRTGGEMVVEEEEEEEEEDAEEDEPDGKDLAARGVFAWSKHLARNDSIIVDLFQGQFKSTLTCDTCRRSSITFDAFMYFSVPLANDSGCSLGDCLEAFLRPEQLSGSSQWSCPHCRQRRDAVKKIDLWRLPPCLLIHLKRFRGAEAPAASGGRKISSPVDFPLSGLRLSGFHGDTAYSLYAVCNHYGRSDSGHYTAACLNEPLGAWHTFDDDSVGRVAPEDVVTPAGYILFYAADSATPGAGTE